MAQAIDRLRLIDTKKRKTVYILCSIPMGSGLTNWWKQLIGDRRLSDALAECDAKGWDALPLGARAAEPAVP